MSDLRLMSSSKGTLTLKDITAPLDEKLEEMTEAAAEEYLQFTDVLLSCDKTQLSEEQRKVLVFVGGYCASKAQLSIQCEDCKNSLMLPKNLHVESLCWRVTSLPVSS